MMIFKIKGRMKNLAYTSNNWYEKKKQQSKIHERAPKNSLQESRNFVQRTLYSKQETHDEDVSKKYVVVCRIKSDYIAYMCRIMSL